MAVLIEQMDGDRPWSPLAPIRPHGSLAPLFCVHPAGGNVLSYYELAHHVHADRPVFALQARGVDGKQPPHATLDEMAEEYIAAMRSVQPSGPYHLVGWSSGGVVAYEIARRLREAGQEIGSVSLIDSRVMSSLDFDPDDDSRILVTLADFLNRFYGFQVAVTYEELEQLDPEARFAYVLEKAKIAGQAPMGLDVNELRTFVEVARANLKVLKDYVPPTSDLPVHLYRAADRLTEQDQDLRDDLGWREIVGDALVVEQSSGDHITMMTGQHAQRLAAAIEASLAPAAAG
jgi:thioesterase domain-containing protein